METKVSVSNLFFRVIIVRVREGDVQRAIVTFMKSLEMGKLLILTGAGGACIGRQVWPVLPFGVGPSFAMKGGDREGKGCF